MIYQVVFSPEAEDQLAELYNYVVKAASPAHPPTTTPGA